MVATSDLARASVPQNSGQNIDLATVPSRDTVQLTIYNSEDLTLVRERRRVSFKRGINRLQFSWANTLIDPTSVELRFPRREDRIAVVDTTFPHAKPQMLYWNVSSEIDGEVEAEITYFTSGLGWSADYVLVADAKERHARIESFIRVSNRSGEDYPDAEVRVVVGTINLVEKISQLANIPMGRVGAMEEKERSGLRYRAAKRAMAAEAMPATVASDQALASAPRQIIKEGLSEYFIYSIEGTETIPNGWSKRLRSFEAEQVPLEVVHRYRERQYGPHLVRLYVTRNDEKSKLGTTPLPNGRMSVFRDTSRDGLVYLASQTIKYVPVGDRLEVNLGVDPDVVFERETLEIWRDELWLELAKGKTYRRVGDGALRLDRRGRIVGWDEHRLEAQWIRNFSPYPIKVEVRRYLPGDIVFRSRLDPERHDYQSLDLVARVPAGKSEQLRYQVTTRQGRNQKQSRLEIVAGKVKPPRSSAGR